jgi:prevent-host-death family protein
MNRNSWTIAEAKARFSKVITTAQSDGPQTITRYGKIAVVIVAAEEWERKIKRKGTLSDFFATSPLRGSQMRGMRLRGRLRKIER